MSYKTYAIDEIRTFAHENSIKYKLFSRDVIVIFTQSELNEVTPALEKGEKHYQISKQYDAKGKFENFIVVIE